MLQHQKAAGSDERRKGWETYKRRIEDQIDALENHISREILRERYTKNREERKWKHIAERMHYEQNWVINGLHPRALREFERKYPEIRKL